MKKNLGVLVCLLQMVAAIANPAELYNQYRHIIDPVLTQAVQLAPNIGTAAGIAPQFSWLVVNRIMFSHVILHATSIVEGLVQSPEIVRLNEECDLLAHSSVFATRANAIRLIVSAYVSDVTSVADCRRQLLTIANQWRQEINERRANARRPIPFEAQGA